MNTHPLLKTLAISVAFAVSFGSAFGSAANAQFMEIKEYAAELRTTEFGNAPTSGGLIYVRRCDGCPVMGVTFRPQTLFQDGRRTITAAAAEKITTRGATVLFDPETRYVTRVIYWPAS